MNKLIPFLAAALLPAVSHALALPFTSQAAFLANVQAGYYLENFNSLPENTSLGGPVSFAGNGFGYDADALNGVYTTTAIAGDVALSNFFSGTVLTISFTGNPVTAVGGNIYGGDALGIYTPGAMTLSLASGETITLPNPTATSFAGFVTSSPIVSLSILPENFNPGYWADLDNLIVGQAVPGVVSEPSTPSLFAIAAVLLGSSRARRRSGRPRKAG